MEKKTGKVVSNSVIPQSKFSKTDQHDAVTAIANYFYSINFQKELGKATYDENAGIAHVKLGSIKQILMDLGLTGKDFTGWMKRNGAIATGNVDDLELHIARVDKKVNPHVHMKGGAEMYIGLDGEGTMHIGRTLSKNELGEYIVDWTANKPISFGKGSVFAIQEGEVHSLENTSKGKKLVIAFICPPSHLTNTDPAKPNDPSADRTFVANQPAYSVQS